MNSIWIIEELPNPGIWNVLQSRGIYKTRIRAERAAKELQRWHREDLKPGNKYFGCHYRATEYAPLSSLTRSKE
jgi:hypothetical protein